MSFVGTLQDVWTKHGSKIMTGVGITGSVAALVMVAYKSATKAPKIVKEVKNDLEEIRAREITDEYTEKDKGKEIAKTYIRGGMAMAKLYGVAFILEVTSIGLIVGSDVKDCRKNAYLSSSLIAAEKTIDTIKNNTIDRFGEDVYYELEHGIKKQEVQIEEEDENGKKKKVKKTVEVADPNHSASHVKYFTKSNPYWDEISGYEGIPNDSYLNTFFGARISALSTRLSAKRNSLKDPFVTSNDALVEFGFEREKEGYGEGWKYDPDRGITCVDISWKKVHIKNEDNQFEEAYAITLHPTHNTMSGELLR